MSTYETFDELPPDTANTMGLVLARHVKIVSATSGIWMRCLTGDYDVTEMVELARKRHGQYQWQVRKGRLYAMRNET